MSTKYKHPNEVPPSVICARLRELSESTKGIASLEREFTMRIPAECDRDADIVLSWAAQLIEQLQQQNAELASKCLDASAIVKMFSGSEVFQESVMNELRELSGDSNKREG